MTFTIDTVIKTFKIRKKEYTLKKIKSLTQFGFQTHFIIVTPENSFGYHDVIQLNMNYNRAYPLHRFHSKEVMTRCETLLIMAYNNHNTIMKAKEQQL